MYVIVIFRYSVTVPGDTTLTILAIPLSFLLSSPSRTPSGFSLEYVYFRTVKP